MNQPLARIATQSDLPLDGPSLPPRHAPVAILVDDFVGQGRTLAKLRCHILDGGSHVAASIVLTGKPYSATLTPSKEQFDELRQ